MDWDKMKLPPLEDILGRVEEREENYENEVILAPVRSRPTFDNHNCVLKEERDGRGKIQTKISPDGYVMGVVCSYYREEFKECRLKGAFEKCMYYG